MVVDNLKVKIFETRQELGRKMAAEVADEMRELLNKKDEIRMVFAAAPSQNEFLASLVNEPGIDWRKVTAFHMDEYLGLPEDSKERFSYFLKEKIFSKLPFKAVHYLQPTDDSPQEECERYSKIYMDRPIDIICMGIGENGHIAFNDPPVADFNDEQYFKIVQLDETCRLQQVFDKCFDTLDQVPQKAITLTIPGFMGAGSLFCGVPGHRKAEAIKRALNDSISPSCPATILRRHPKAVLYLDQESAALVFKEKV
ncbi:MAG TPA: glucosamine-6-phosphate deaminase [Calditrichaeota bacterium]|nr:glucosamine-6-phosphate deaminase [Calditrichota bacterium]